MSSEVAAFLPHNWEWSSVGLICDAGGGDVQTGPFGSQLHAADYVADGVPSVMPQDLVGGRIDTTKIARISPADRDRLARYTLRPNDIVYARRGDLTRRALVTEEHDGWLCGTGCLRIRPGTAASSVFLFYALGAPHAQEWIGRHAVGATMPNLNTEILRACPVLRPHLGEQRRIATVLSTLDDKIESNRRVAGTLHNLATVQFAHQFGDLALARATLAGWIEGTLGDLVDVNMGQSPPGSTYSSDPSGGLLLVQGMGGMGDRFPISDVFTTAPTKVAPAGTTLMTVRAPVGAVNVAHVEVCLGRGVAGISSPRPAFTEYLVRALERRWSSEESGTIFPAVNRKQIVGLPVAVPPERELDAFEAFAAPIVRKLTTLHGETETLIALRDELLPKLVSGGLRVPPDEAEGQEPAE